MEKEQEVEDFVDNSETFDQEDIKRAVKIIQNARFECDEAQPTIDWYEA